MSQLLCISDAVAVVMDGRHPLAPVDLDIDDVLGCVLADAMVASSDVPRFSNSAMDGFALRSTDTASKLVELRIIDTALAGRPSSLEIGPGEAVRIMTGAVLPAGADSVCMVEKTHVGSDDDHVLIEVAVAPGEHVRGAGEDIRRGDVVMEAGTVLRPAHLGILASLGVTKVLVHPKPRVGVLSTGDELVEGDVELSSGQIRDSNRHALLASVRSSGFVGIDCGIVRDEPGCLESAIADAATKCDALLTSGGVSVGDADFVKGALAVLCGASMRWMQVAVKPAKPFAFGVLRANGVPVFGLPGNPVSSLVSFELFARPALRRLAGHREIFRPTVFGTADETIARRDDGKVHLVNVRVSIALDGQIRVRPIGPQASHVLSTVARANALAIIPNGCGVRVGEEVEVMPLDWDQVDWASRERDRRIGDKL